MTEQTQDLSSPYGRYLAPLWQRLLQLINLVWPAIFIITLSRQPGQAPSWFIGIMVTLYALTIVLNVPQWFIPLTTIDEHEIRRRWPRRPRQIWWREVFDARFDSTFGTTYVILLLWSGQHVKLYGVPETAVEGIRRIAAENPAHPAHRQDSAV